MRTKKTYTGRGRRNFRAKWRYYLKLEQLFKQLEVQSD